MLVMMRFGRRELVVVVERVGNNKLGGVHTASFYLLSCRAAFGATTSVISPKIYIKNIYLINLSK